MQAKARDPQGEFYSVRLDFLCNEAHPLVRLAKVIDWSQFDESFGKLYSAGQGRPAKPTRLMVGLHYLKHAKGLSDEDRAREVGFFGLTTDLGTAVSLMANDMHEHLGQSIAYARMNQIVPPWSRPDGG